jgi:hypothetical protein
LDTSFDTQPNPLRYISVGIGAPKLRDRNGWHHAVSGRPRIGANIGTGVLLAPGGGPPRFSKNLGTIYGRRARQSTYPSRCLPRPVNQRTAISRRLTTLRPRREFLDNEIQTIAYRPSAD